MFRKRVGGMLILLVSLVLNATGTDHPKRPAALRPKVLQIGQIRRRLTNRILALKQL